MKSIRLGGVKAAVCASVLACVGMAQAAFFEYGDKGVNHYFLDGSAWNQGRAPRSGDSMQLSGLRATESTGCATWMTNNFVEALSSIEFKGGTRAVGKVFTFSFITKDGIKATGNPVVFRMPDTNIVYYSTAPFTFKAYENGDRQLGALDATDRTSGAYSFYGANLQIGGTADTTYFINFAEGAYNFLDPNGHAIETTLLFGNSASNVGIPERVTFSPNTSLRFSTLTVAAGTDEKYAGVNVAFNGLAEMTGGTSLTVQQGVCDIFGGTDLVVPSVSLSGGKLNLFGAGTTIDATSFNTSGGDAVVSNAATMTVGTLELGDASRLTVADAGSCLYADGALAFKENALLHVKDGAAVSVKSFGGMANSTIILDGGSFTNRSPTSMGNGSAEKPMKLVLNSGRYYGVGTLSLNDYTIFEVNGGSAHIASPDGFSMGWNGVTGAVLRVNGGTFQASRFRLGRNPTARSSSLVEMNGGTIIVSGYNYINFHQNNTSFNGENNIVLNGGTLQVPIINAGDADKVGDVTDDKVCATLTGDGGTLRAVGNRSSASAPYIEAMRHIYCGDGALTLDTQSYTTYLNHPLENKKNEEGVFRKIGSGTLIFATNAYAVAETTVSTIDVAEGAFRFADGMTLGSTALVVRPGATLTLDAGASITVKSFAATNATIKLSAGSTITILDDRGLSLSGVTFDWTTVPTEATGVFVVKGTIDAETQHVILGSLYKQGAGDGREVTFAFAYDAVKDQTTVTTHSRAKTDLDAPLTSQAVWTGSGAWATASNWQDATKPDMAKVAVFGAGAAGKDVTIGATSVAGAISFTDSGYDLAGEGTIFMDAERGASAITAVAGTTNAVSAAMTCRRETSVDVGAGAQLTLDGTLAGAPIAKTGLGKLVLGAANAFTAGSTLSLSGGITKVTASNALGSSLNETVLVDRDTVEFESADGEDLTIGAALSLGGLDTSVAAKTEPLVFNAKSNVEFARLNNQTGHAGDPIKIGAGRLTLNVRPDSTKDVFVRSNDGNNLSGSDVKTLNLVFPADGTKPSGRYAALTVAEGELYMKSTNPNATILLPHRIAIGSPYSACQVAPSLTIDNCAFKMCDAAGTYGETLQLGYCINEPGYGSNNNPTIRIINGGILTACGFVPGYAVTRPGSTVTVAVTNGLFRVVSSYCYLSRMYCLSDKNVRARYYLKDAKMDCLNGQHTAYLGGGVTIDADNSVFCGKDGSPLRLVYADITGEACRFYGDFNFYNGSVFAVSQIEDSGHVPFKTTFAFNDATWKWADDCGDFTNGLYASGEYVFEMRGKGVHLTPAAGKTFTTLTPFTGEGGLIMGGAGTVRFGAGAYAFTGTCALTNALGTVDLGEAGTIDEATFSGVGTVNGGAITRAIVDAQLADDWSTDSLPVFRDVAITRLVIDAGRATALALPAAPTAIPVAKVEGSTTIGRVLITGTASPFVSATFEVNGGFVYMTPAPKRGTLMLIR